MWVTIVLSLSMGPWISLSSVNTGWSCRVVRYIP
jgi:hypothetical protein